MSLIETTKIYCICVFVYETPQQDSGPKHTALWDKKN